MSLLNSAEQRVNQYEIIRGNPNLKTMKIIDGLLAYNYNVRKLSMSVYASYHGLLDLAKTNYYYDDNDIIHTYLTDGAYHDFSYGLNIVSRLLNNSLQIRGSIGMQNQYVTGRNSSHNNRLSLSLFAAYFVKGFSVSAYYKPYDKRLSNSLCFTENRADYGITASWGYRGWLAEVGCRRPFEGNAHTVSYYDFGAYHYYTKNFYDVNGRQVFVRLAYNFDFGRNVKREKVDIDNSNKSGILHI